MSLQIPKVLGPSGEEELEIRNRWATMEVVLQRLAARGIQIQEEPPPFPIPSVTTTLVSADHQEYLKVNAQYLAWLDYLMPHLARTKGYLLEAKNEMDHIDTLYRRDARTNCDGLSKKRVSEKEIEENIKTDPRYLELKQLEQEMLEEKEFLEDKITVLDRTMKVISRHVEMKKIDVEENRTAANLPRRRPQFGSRD